MIPFNIIVAVDEKFGIGKEGQLPWHLKADLKHFKEITTHSSDAIKQNVVIMGRKTWDSLPEKFRPLPQRINVVLTKNKNLSLPENVVKSESLDEALNVLGGSQWKDKIGKVFVIGGGEIFKEAVKSPSCQALYLTHILGSFDCDVFFPSVEDFSNKENLSLELQEDSLKYYFALYRRRV